MDALFRISAIFLHKTKSRLLQLTRMTLRGAATVEKPSTPAARAVAAIAIIENFILVVVSKVVSSIEDYEQILCDEDGNESDVMSTWEEHALGMCCRRPRFA